MLRAVSPWFSAPHLGVVPPCRPLENPAELHRPESSVGRSNNGSMMPDAPTEESVCPGRRHPTSVWTCLDVSPSVAIPVDLHLPGIRCRHFLELCALAHPVRDLHGTLDHRLRHIVGVPLVRWRRWFAQEDDVYPAG